MSEEIVEAVAKAMAQADGFHAEAVSNDEDSVPAWSLYIAMARAGIEEYERQKQSSPITFPNVRVMFTGE